MKWALIAWALAVPSTQALAQATSVTTPFDLDKCKHTASDEPEDYGEWRCRGHAGISVFVTAGDQRSYVSFGAKAKSELAAKQTLAAFNSSGDKIEWRGVTSGGKFRPYAAIIRFSVTGQKDSGPVEGEMVVVYRLPPGGSCHVGYVDAKANANADELARKIADESARAFKCRPGNKPMFLGVKGPGFSGPYD